LCAHRRPRDPRLSSSNSICRCDPPTCPFKLSALPHHKQPRPEGPSAHRQTRCIAESWQLQQRCEASFSELCNSNRMIYKPACSGTLGSLFSTKLSTTSYVRAGPRCLSRPPLSPNFCLSTNTFRRRPIECRNMATLSAQRKHKVTVVGSGNWYVLHRLRRSKWQDVVMLQPSERS
jgi:hypothetical protein